MIETLQFYDQGVPVYLCECTTPEEVQEAGLPPSMTHYWRKGNDKILSSLVIVHMIQSAAIATAAPARKLLEQANIKVHAQTMLDQQWALIFDTLKTTRNRYAEDQSISPTIKATLLENLDRTIAAYKSARSFDAVDGHGLRYSPEVAESLGITDLPYIPPQQPVTL